MDTSKYRALRPEALREIETRRLTELEAAHYRLALDVEDAVALDDQDALQALMPGLQSLGARISRAHAALSPAPEPADEAE